MALPIMFNVISWMLLNLKSQYTRKKSLVELKGALKQPYLSLNAVCGIMHIIFNVSLGTEVTYGLCLYCSSLAASGNTVKLVD